MKHTRLGNAKKGLACANVKYSLLVAIATGKLMILSLGPICRFPKIF